MHVTPAGLPSGIPGIGEEIESAIQHAPHFVRHSILQIYTNIIINKAESQAGFTKELSSGTLPLAKVMHIKFCTFTSNTSDEN